MTPRRISAVLCLAGALLIVWGVVNSSWWRGRLENRVAVADLKIGLTAVTGCAHDQTGTWRCESVEWKQVGVTTE